MVARAIAPCGAAQMERDAAVLAGHCPTIRHPRGLVCGCHTTFPDEHAWGRHLTQVLASQ